MSIKLVIFILFNFHSMVSNLLNINGHNRDIIPYGMDIEHSVVATNINMEHYKNLSLENIVEEIDGIIYTEEWRDVSGYEGLYKVSNFGRIKSLYRQESNTHNGILKFRKEKIRLTLNSHNGYKRISLFKNLKSKNYPLHRLVAIAFIDNPENKSFINHKDGIKTNNFVNNLEWCTISENQIHAYRILKRKFGWSGEKGGMLIVAKSINKYDLNDNFIKRYSSIIEAEIEIKGRNNKSIGHCLKGRIKTCYGFKWRYA